MKMRRRATLNDLLNDLTFSSLFNHYKNVTMNMFKWDGLPEGIEERFLERILFEQGRILFFRDPAMSYMALPCHNGAQLDVYGEPLNWVASGLNYNRTFPREKCVLIENNKLRTPSHDIVMMYVYKMYQASRTMDVNLKTSKVPWIILCDERNLLTYKEVLKKIDDNEHAIFGAKGLNMDAIQVLPTKSEFIGNELMDFHRSIEAQLLTVLGIDNCPVDKKERLVTDEARSNNQLITVNADLMLESRKRACDAINEMFELSVSVELRHKPQEEGGEEDAPESATKPDNE